MTAPTVAEALDDTARRLFEAGIEAARLEARLLVGHALDRKTEALIADPDYRPDSPALARLGDLVGRRVRREPMSHLLGRREFWSLEFEVSADVLDPRPDSETLVQAALDEIPAADAPLELLDLGTGSGCLLLSLLSELPHARGLGIDLSPGAVAVAERNARRLGLAPRAAFAVGDWGRKLTGRFDVILANPPYIPSADIARLQPEIAGFEPRPALDGGADGLFAYRNIAPGLIRLLAPEGFACIEVGEGQASDVMEIFSGEGLDIRALRYDLNGIGRCLVVENAGRLTEV